MHGRTYFSADYAESRERFRHAAEALGARLEVHPLRTGGPDGEPLTIDLAWLGPRDASRVVGVTSGTHGVEGFMGAAVQLQLLDDMPPLGGDDVALFFVHAVNPYGFAFVRRVNEDNVDLNRNFLQEGEPWEGAPGGYGALDGMLNPKRPPSGLARTAFPVRAALNIVRTGLTELKAVVAGGQYVYPKGLFFGGHGPSNTMEILQDAMPRWLDAAEHVLIIDFHTGLGPRASYKLLIDEPTSEPRGRWLAKTFGEKVVQGWGDDSVAYNIRGGFGTWVKSRFPGRSFDVLAAEFGTVNVLQVITALSMENRAHHWGRSCHPSTDRAKLGLMEAFAPSDPRWRDTVVERGRQVVERALEVV